MRTTATILCLFLACPAMAADAVQAKLPAPIKSYDDGVINAFQIMCTIEPLNFDRISAKASAMGMRPSTDKNEKESTDATRHVQSFEGNLDSGPFTLLLEKIESPAVNAVTCGAAANIKDKTAYKKNVIQRLHLKVKGEQHTLPNGNELTYWKDAYGPHTVINITEVTGSDGVIIQLLDAQAAK